MMDVAARPAEAEPDLSAIAADAAGEHGVGRPAVYVYEAPVRICHWVNAFSTIVLMVTGYLIGTPLPSIEGEASANFVMGYIRFAHFAAGQVLAVFLPCPHSVGLRRKSPFPADFLSAGASQALLERSAA
ncbi:hypothetical protein ACVWW5_007135 [Bradyrhizobium sp. LM3.4]